MNETGFECQPSELIFIDDENDLKSKKENYQILLEACNKNASGKVDCILTIFEGKFHQVKRMFSQLGNKVIYLKRIEMGKLVLDSNLELGSYRELTEKEIEILSEKALNEN